MGEDNREQEERPDSYFIPDNFTDSGRLFNGLFDTRKFIEACIIGAIMWFIEKNTFYASMEKTSVAILIMIATIAPVAIVSLIGINGDCITVFLRSVFVFIKDRRKLRFRRIQKNVEKNIKKH